MKDSMILMILLQIVLIALNAFFACAEIALISVNDTRLAKLTAEGDKRAERLSKLTHEPSRFLATIQVAITLSGFLGSAFAAENFSGRIVNALLGLGVPIPEHILNTIAVIVITIILSYFTLVLGELVPKQVAMRKAEPLALAISGFLIGISKLFAPLVSLLTVSTNGVLRLIGIDPNAVDEEVGEEEIRMMVDAGSEKGTIDSTECEFIQNVFEFDNISIEELVTHRKDVTMLDMEDSDEEWKNIIFNTGYTYYPVCDGSADKIIGVLNTKKYFRLSSTEREYVMQNAVVPAYFVPETLKADTLFQNMKNNREGIAIVLDEYGGTSGLITIKDLLEELVGDMEDDIVTEEPDDFIEKIGDDIWRIAGGAALDEVSEAVGVYLADDEYDTLNGLIFHKLESLPTAQTEIEVANLKIKVIEIQNYQVKTAIVRKLPTPVSEEGEE